MALKFEKKELVEFGDIKALPKDLDTEAILRLQQIKLETAEGIIEAIKLLSSCFETQNERIAEFMTKNMSDYDLRRLQVYLLKGPQMLKDMTEGIRDLIVEEARNA